MDLKKYMRALIQPLYSIALLLSAFHLLGTVSVYAEDKPKAPKAGEKDAAEPAKPVEEALEPGAEFSCESEISYIWKKITPKQVKDPKTGKASETFETGDSDTEFFATVGETGQLKTEVAHRLSVKLPTVQDEAMVHCRSIHQNLTGCIGSWLDSSANEYATLDFELRKRLLASIKARCEESFGLCVDTSATSVKCHVSRSPDVKKTEAAASGGAEKGKAPAKKGEKK